MIPPTRDGVGRCPDQKQRPTPAKNLEHQHEHQQRQRSATTPVTRIVARTSRACDTLVILSLDTAALARRTGQAKHAEATTRLLSAITDVWRAGEALAESAEEVRR